MTGDNWPRIVLPVSTAIPIATGTWCMLHLYCDGHIVLMWPSYEGDLGNRQLGKGHLL